MCYQRCESSADGAGVRDGSAADAAPGVRLHRGGRGRKGRETLFKLVIFLRFFFSSHIYSLYVEEKSDWILVCSPNSFLFTFWKLHLKSDLGARRTVAP